MPSEKARVEKVNLKMFPEGCNSGTFSIKTSMNICV